MRLGDLIKEKNYSAVIFPEGTRKGNDLKPFKPGGVAALLRKAPNALVVPIAIEGTMNINMHRAYPLNSFQKLKWTVLEPLEPKDYSLDELMTKSRKMIADVLKVD
jgi:1-acyl-sn-glycerol-3-phosphate acyltransferase